MRNRFRGSPSEIFRVNGTTRNERLLHYQRRRLVILYPYVHTEQKETVPSRVFNYTKYSFIRKTDVLHQLWYTYAREEI